MAVADAGTLDDLLAEYDLARGWSERLVADLDDEQVRWRPNENASGIGWHLGHQAAVNHYLVRNLTAAEPSLDPALDALFDSATPEPDRGGLPSMSTILDYRREIASRTVTTIGRIRDGEVGAPNQLPLIASGLLTAVVNHEYQHDTWVAEVRATLGAPAIPGPPSPAVIDIAGYWVLR